MKDLELGRSRVLVLLVHETTRFINMYKTFIAQKIPAKYEESSLTPNLPFLKCLFKLSNIVIKILHIN